MTWVGEAGGDGSGLLVYTDDGSPGSLVGSNDQVIIWQDGQPIFVPQTSLTGVPQVGGIGLFAFDYKFDSTTSDSDPGQGNLRLNNSDQDAATQIYVDVRDENDSALGTILQIPTSGSIVALQERKDATRWKVYRLLGDPVLVGSINTGYIRYPELTFIDGGDDIEDGEEIVFSFLSFGTQFLNDLGDVDAPSPNVEDALVFNGSVWVPSGISTGGATAPDVIEPDSRYVSRTDSPTTTSTTDILSPGMQFTVPTGTWDIWFNGSVTHDTNGGNIFLSIYAGGVQIADSEREWERQAGFLVGSQHGVFTCLTEINIPEASGNVLIEGRIRTDTGTATTQQRSLLARRAKPSGA